MFYATSPIQLVNHVIIYIYTITNVIMDVVMKETFWHYAHKDIAYIIYKYKCYLFYIGL
jgi:hypothetical protein